MRSFTARGVLHLEVNGDCRSVDAAPADSLLHVLREGLGLTGAKPGCENGDCGACTVLLAEVPVKSCLVLAVEAEGRPVTTVEGLDMVPAQTAFLDAWALQCGYCTSGFVVLCHALDRRHPDADAARTLDWLRANICRCTGYAEITAAARASLGAGGQGRP